jgi:hypothetical protein
METSAAIAAFFKAMFVKGLLPAIIGSFIAALMGNAKTKLERVGYFFVGVATAHYGGGLLIDWYPFTSDLAQDGVKFSIGVIGMGIVQQVLQQIPVVARSLRLKFIGHDPDSVKGDLK